MATESAAKLFARLGARQIIMGLEDRLFGQLEFGGLTCGDVIEFYGSEGCGKTEMLLHLLAVCIMPEQFNGVTMHGRSITVIYVDGDCRFNLLRLMCILEQRYYKACKKVAVASPSLSNNSEVFVKLCLERFHVVRSESIHQLIATLHWLEGSISSHPDIGVMMIDGIGSFYWQDKFTCNKAVDKLCKTIKYLCHEHNLIVIATKAAIKKSYDNSFRSNANASSSNSVVVTSRYDDTQTGHIEYMPNTWKKLVRYRYILTRLGSTTTKSMAKNDSEAITASYSIKLDYPTSTVISHCFTIDVDGIRFF